ncbi:MAG: hypothetical protein ACYTE5_05890 [Planctomycetota bacterium]|jgi:hypothetical protein
MKNEKLKTITENLEPLSLMWWFFVFSFSFSIYLVPAACLAVTTNVTRHSSSVDLMKGDTEDVVVDSRGNLQLGQGPFSSAQAPMEVSTNTALEN